MSRPRWLLFPIGESIRSKNLTFAFKRRMEDVEMKVAGIQNDQIEAAVHPVKRAKAGFHDPLEWAGAADETDEGVLDRDGSAWSPSHKVM